MSGGEVIRLLNRSGCSARIIAGLNLVAPEARGMSYERWIQSLPIQVFRKGPD